MNPSSSLYSSFCLNMPNVSPCTTSCFAWAAEAGSALRTSGGLCSASIDVCSAACTEVEFLDIAAGMELMVCASMACACQHTQDVLTLKARRSSASIGCTPKPIEKTSAWRSETWRTSASLHRHRQLRVLTAKQGVGSSVQACLHKLEPCRGSHTSSGAVAALRRAVL